MMNQLWQSSVHGPVHGPVHSPESTFCTNPIDCIVYTRDWQRA